MLPAFCALPGVVPATAMYDTLSQLGLLTNLKLCLDAGDALSYTSGQTWSDRSGGAYDFFRGTTSGAEGSDPTFNGTAGRQSSGEYFSVDGGDWFTLGQANPSWVTAIHKANATYSIFEWVYLNNITSVSQPFASIGNDTSGGSTGVGFQFGGSASSLRTMNISITGSGGAVVLNKNSTTTANNNAWNFLAMSADLTTGTVIFQINGTTDTFTSQSYLSPSAASAAAALQIGAFGGGFAPESTGDRFSSVGIENVALTGPQLLSLFTATRAKFGV